MRARAVAAGSSSRSLRQRSSSPSERPLRSAACATSSSTGASSACLPWERRRAPGERRARPPLVGEKRDPRETSATPSALVRAWVYADGRMIWSAGRSWARSRGREPAHLRLPRATTHARGRRAPAVGGRRTLRSQSHSTRAADRRRSADGAVHRLGDLRPARLRLLVGVVGSTRRRPARPPPVAVHQVRGGSSFRGVSGDLFERERARSRRRSRFRLSGGSTRCSPTRRRCCRRARGPFARSGPTCRRTTQCASSTSPPKDASQLLSLLPARAADLLRGKSRTWSEGDVALTVGAGDVGRTVVVGR